MDDEFVKETNENPPNPPASSDLDIVDVLGTLNLDEEFELTNKDTGNAKEKKGTQSSNEAAKQRDTATSNTPFCNMLNSYMLAIVTLTMGITIIINNFIPNIQHNKVL